VISAGQTPTGSRRRRIEDGLRYNGSAVIAFMLDVPSAAEPTLELVAPDNSRPRVCVTESPFFIGRQGMTCDGP
jgi:hypothetical protein